jgi:hypothetical protein
VPATPRQASIRQDPAHELGAHIAETLDEPYHVVASCVVALDDHDNPVDLASPGHRVDGA